MGNIIVNKEKIKITGLLNREIEQEPFPIVLHLDAAPDSEDVKLVGTGNERIGDGSAFIDCGEIKFKITGSPAVPSHEYCAVFNTFELPKSYRRRNGIDTISNGEVFIRFDSTTHKAVRESIERLNTCRRASIARERTEELQKLNTLEALEAEANAAVALSFDFGFQCPDVITLIYADRTGYSGGAIRTPEAAIRLTEIIKRHIREDELREIAIKTKAEVTPTNHYSSGGWRFDRAGLKEITTLAVERERVFRSVK